MEEGQGPDYCAQLATQPARPLQVWELEVLQALALNAGLNADIASLTRGACARTMMDGGMGSFQITPPTGDVSVAWFSAAELWYRDSDGVEVFLALNLNEAREPVEVDIWKADSTAMIRPPAASDLQPLPQGHSVGGL